MNFLAVGVFDAFNKLSEGLSLQAAFEKVLFGARAAGDLGVWGVLTVLGGVLLAYGCAEAFRRGAAEGKIAGDRLMAVFLAVAVLGILNSTEAMNFMPKVWDAAASAMGTSDNNKNLDRMVDAFFATETSLNSVQVDGANRVGWFKSIMDATSPIQSAMNSVLRILRAWAAFLLFCWVAAWMLIGSVISGVVVWCSKVAYMISYALLPLALGATTVESLRGMAFGYIRILIGLSAANFGVAVLNIGTSAFLGWFASLAAMSVDNDSIRGALSTALTNPNVTLSADMKKTLVSSIFVAGPGYWLLIAIGAAFIGIWVIFASFFGARMIYKTIVSGEGPGTIAFQTAGAFFTAAGNTLQLASRMSVAAGGGRAAMRSATGGGGTGVSGGQSTGTNLAGESSPAGDGSENEVPAAPAPNENRQISPANGAQGRILAAAAQAYQSARAAGMTSLEAQAAAGRAAMSSGASPEEAAQCGREAAQLVEPSADKGGRTFSGVDGGRPNGTADSGSTGSAGAAGTSGGTGAGGGSPGARQESRGALAAAIGGAALSRAGQFIAQQESGGFAAGVSVGEEGYSIYRQARSQLAQEQTNERLADDARDKRQHRRRLESLGAQQVTALRQAVVRRGPRS